MIEIRYAELADKVFWYSLDRHLPAQEYERKVREHQAYVLFENGNPKAVLRYNLFWDNTPFCTMLFVAESAQRQGFGRQLMEHWDIRTAADLLLIYRGMNNRWNCFSARLCKILELEFRMNREWSVEHERKEEFFRAIEGGAEQNTQSYCAWDRRGFQRIFRYR